MSAVDAFIRFCRENASRLTIAATTQPIIHVRANPALVWPIPNYFPPPQRAAANKIGFARSNEVNKLKQLLANQLKCGEAYGDMSDPDEQSVVVVIGWKQRQRYDYGNFVQACKAVLDSLQPDIIANDNQNHIFDFYSQRLAKEDKMPVGTLVVVYRVESVSSRIGRVSIASQSTTVALQRSGSKLGHFH